MINNLLLLASAIYIYADAMRTLKGFISSNILHLCLMFLQSWSAMLYVRPVAVTGAWSKLHLLSQPSSSQHLHATYLFRRWDPVVILPKHASPVMLNEPASASSAVRLYALEFTGLKNGNFLFLL